MQLYLLEETFRHSKGGKWHFPCKDDSVLEETSLKEKSNFMQSFLMFW